MNNNKQSPLFDALKYIVENYGVEAFEDSNLINCSLADLAKSDEINRRKIRLALASGAGSDFYKLYVSSNGAFGEPELQKFNYSLMAAGFTSDFSEYVISAFLYAVSIQQIEKAQTENDADSFLIFKDDDKHQVNIDLIDGSNYNGEWQNGKANGYGCLTFAQDDELERESYNGFWQDGKFSGHGILKWKHGGIYNGKFLFGHKNGKDSTELFCDKSKYVGGYINDKFDGYGLYIYPKESDQLSYEGDWKEGKKNGYGKMIWKNGSVYEGEWKKDSRHGNGTQRNSNGEIYSGNFENDIISGFGQYTYSNGWILIADFKNGNACGDALIKLPNGDRYYCGFNDGEHSREGTYVWADGTMLKGVFDDFSVFPLKKR